MDAAAAVAHPPAASAGAAEPYVGPRAFRPGESLHGRERETRDLTELLAAERIVLCHSPSGAGKTSLIQARLVPALSARFAVRGPARVSDPASVGVEGANRYVLSALLGMEGARKDGERMAVETLAKLSLEAYLELRAERSERAGADGEPPPSRPEVLIFDQFEEILTLAQHETEEKTEFFRQVGEALRAPRRRALFAIREEYVASLDPYVHCVPTRLSVRYALDLLDARAACDAIAEPAKTAGVPFTPEALDTLVENLRRAPQPGSPEGVLGRYVEPVQLQVVCTRIWRNRPKDATRIDQVGGVDDVDTALAEYYAETVARVAEERKVSERKIRRWFGTALISAGVRAQVARGGEAAYGLDEEVVKALVDAYLVRREERRTSLWYELAHDRLIGPVQNGNAAWFGERIGQLQRQAESWAAAGKPEGMLFRRGALKDAQLWASAHPDERTPEVDAFLIASTLAQRSGSKKVAVALTFALLLALAGVLFLVDKNAELRDKTALLEEVLRRNGGRTEDVPLVQAVQASVRADSALEVSRKQGDTIQRGLDVWYFPKPDDPAIPRILETQGFSVRAISGRNRTPTNALMYGESVEAGSIRLLAYALLRANVPLKVICPLQNRDRDMVVQVLAITSAGDMPAVTLEQVAAMTDEARSVNCGRSAGVAASSRPNVYLHFYGDGDEAADRRRLEALRPRLEAAGYAAPGVDSVTAQSGESRRSEVRYFRRADRALADSVGVLTAQLLGLPAPLPSRQMGYYQPARRTEVWLDLTAPPGRPVRR